MHCPTEELANKVLAIGEVCGRTWSSGDKYSDKNLWERNKKESCYNLNTGEIDDIDFYTQQGYNIISAEEFIALHKKEEKVYLKKDENLNKKLIGIIGKKRTGKDTIGDYLVNNNGFIKYSFANPLKYGAMEIFGFTKEQVFGDSKDVVDSNWGTTPRLILQIMGTELFQYEIQKYIPEFKEIGRNIWVKRFIQWYSQNNSQNIVICDVRFKHEAESILALGGEIWKVTRDVANNDNDKHSSEVELEDITNIANIISNNSTFDSLYETIFNSLK